MSATFEEIHQAVLEDNAEKVRRLLSPFSSRRLLRQELEGRTLLEIAILRKKKAAFDGMMRLLVEDQTKSISEKHYDLALQVIQEDPHYFLALFLPCAERKEKLYQYLTRTDDPSVLSSLSQRWDMPWWSMLKRFHGVNCPKVIAYLRKKTLLSREHKEEIHFAIIGNTLIKKERSEEIKILRADLLFAIRSNAFERCVEIISFLKQKGVSQSTFKYYCNHLGAPLYLATHGDLNDDRLKIIELLLKNGANPRDLCPYYYNVPVSQVLIRYADERIQCGVSTREVEDEYVKKVLHLFSQYGAVSEPYFKEQGAQPDADCASAASASSVSAAESVLRQDNTEEAFALHDAASQGNHVLCNALIQQQGADTRKRNKAGLTPLHVALLAEEMEVVECLLNYPVDFSLDIERLNQTLSLLSYGLKTLILDSEEERASLDDVFVKLFPLFVEQGVCFEGTQRYFTRLKTVIESEPNENVLTELRKITLLFNIARLGLVKSAKFLLHTVKVNINFGPGSAFPLCAAIESSSNEMLQLFFASGAKPNPADFMRESGWGILLAEGLSPLAMAIQCDNREVGKRLLQRGAHLHSSANGKPVFHLKSEAVHAWKKLFLESGQAVSLSQIEFSCDTEVVEKTSPGKRKQRKKNKKVLAASLVLEMTVPHYAEIADSFLKRLIAEMNPGNRDQLLMFFLEALKYAGDQGLVSPLYAGYQRAEGVLARYAPALEKAYGEPCCFLKAVELKSVRLCDVLGLVGAAFPENNLLETLLDRKLASSDNEEDKAIYRGMKEVFASMGLPFNTAENVDEAASSVATTNRFSAA